MKSTVMRQTRGLTLVELLAALAITALLVGASLRAVATLGRSDTIRQERSDVSSRSVSLERVLGMDITHTQRFRNVKGAVALQTYLAIDPATFETAHLPVTVRYEIVIIDKRSWLVHCPSYKVG